MSRRFNHLLLLLWVVAVSACLAGCGTKESRARKHHENGLLYAKNRQFRKATDHFTKAIQLDPTNSESHYQL